MLEKIACLVGERTSQDQRTKPQDTVSHKYKQVPAAKRRQQIDSPIQVIIYSIYSIYLAYLAYIAYISAWNSQ